MPGTVDVNVSVEEVDPPGTSVTVLGLNEPVRPDEVAAVRETVSLKSCMLEMLMMEVADVPAGKVMELGAAEIAKSGGKTTVTFWDVVPAAPCESLADRWTMYAPGAKAWATVLPIATVPSPKSQLKVYGPVPPDPVPLKVIVCAEVGFEGL